MFDKKEMDTVSRNIRQIIGARPGWKAMYFKGDAFYTEEICAWAVLENDSIVGQVAHEWVGFADEAVRPDYDFSGYLSPGEWIDDAGIIHNTQGIWAVKRLFGWLCGKEGC